MALLAGRSNYNDLHILLASKLTKSTQEKPRISLRAAGWKTTRRMQKRQGATKSPLGRVRLKKEIFNNGAEKFLGLVRSQLGCCVVSRYLRWEGKKKEGKKWWKPKTWAEQR